MLRKPVLAIVCCAFFLLTCCAGVADETVAGPGTFPARGTVEFRTASGSEAESYQLGDTVYLYMKGNVASHTMGQRFVCEVTDSRGSTQYEVTIYDIFFERTDTFVIDSWDPTGQWKATLTYYDIDTPPKGVKMDTDKVDVVEP